MIRSQASKSKILKKSAFLEFFTFVEKRAATSNIVLSSSEKKSLFIFEQGHIVAHKSNVQREHSLDKVIKNVQTPLDEDALAWLNTVAPMDQWRYLYKKNHISRDAYQNLLEADCAKILQKHFSAQQTLLLKMPQRPPMSLHGVGCSPFKAILNVLKKDIQNIERPLDSKRINIEAKKKDVFELYLEKIDGQQKHFQYNNQNDSWFIDKPNQNIVFDLWALKENYVVELNVLLENTEQKDIIVSEKDLANKNAFEIFDLDENANGALIKKKYMEMVALYHPDKNGHLPENQKKITEKIFALITLAYKKISAAESRKEYIKTLTKKTVNTEASKKQVQAETMFLEGLASMKSKDFKSAHMCFVQCDALVSSEKYRIYAAWAQFRFGEETQSRMSIEEARENLKKEILRDMPMLEALFYLAGIEKSLGNYKLAKYYLTQVVSRDPYFMNAKVELNLIEQRI